MNEAGHVGADLSLVAWLNTMQFIPPGGIPVADLSDASLVHAVGQKGVLGCLERWRLVTIQVRPTEEQDAKRDGWGSGRGITTKSVVRLARRGRQAAEIWPSLIPLVESRWRDRFGVDLMHRLAESLAAIETQLDRRLPLALSWDLRVDASSYPLRSARGQGGSTYLRSLPAASSLIGSPSTSARALR